VNINFILKILSQFSNWLKTVKALIVVLLSIITINIGLYSFSSQIKFSSSQARNDASGFTFGFAKKFIYFYYYTGDFPLATTNTSLKYSKKAALDEIKVNGNDLIMEYYHWSRLGEHARILAFLPNIWISGSPLKPSIRFFNCLIFIIALLILYSGFWYSKKASFGFLLVFLVNTTPFYLFEVFVNQNIFGLLGATFFIALGVNLYFFHTKKTLFFWGLIVSVFTGIVIGFFSEFRNEVSIVLLSVILIYFLANTFKILYKIGLIIVLIFSFNSTKKVFRNYFNTKFEKTLELVGLHGGHVYNGAKISGHNFWHPLYCGLGDFDTKYGYEWNDLAAYKYAIPKLNEKYNMKLKYSFGQYHLDEYYDKARKYYVKPEELKYYEIVMKEKVLSDIKSDPLWYLEIIWKRTIRVLSLTLPYSYLGFIMLPLLYYLIGQKKWHWLKLLIVSMPLSATSIVVFSGKGTTYNSVFGYFVVIIIVYEVFHFFNKRAIK